MTSFRQVLVLLPLLVVNNAFAETDAALQVRAEIEGVIRILFESRFIAQIQAFDTVQR